MVQVISQNWFARPAAIKFLFVMSTRSISVLPQLLYQYSYLMLRFFLKALMFRAAAHNHYHYQSWSNWTTKMDCRKKSFVKPLIQTHVVENPTFNPWLPTWTKCLKENNDLLCPKPRRHVTSWNPRTGLKQEPFVRFALQRLEWFKRTFFTCSRLTCNTSIWLNLELKHVQDE